MLFSPDASCNVSATILDNVYPERLAMIAALNDLHRVLHRQYERQKEDLLEIRWALWHLKVGIEADARRIVTGRNL